MVVGFREVPQRSWVLDPTRPVTASATPPLPIHAQAPDAPLQFSGSRTESVGLTVYIEPHGDSSSASVLLPAPPAPLVAHNTSTTASTARSTSLPIVDHSEVLVEDTQLAAPDALQALAARAVTEVPAIDAAALAVMCRDLRGAMLEIFKGHAPSTRHQAYKRKGRDRDELKLTVCGMAGKDDITHPGAVRGADG